MGGTKKTTAPKAAKSADELVLHALRLAATNPKAKWSGATTAALFSTKEANTAAALAECTDPAAPLLKQAGAGGALTAAGFTRVANELPAEAARAVYEQLAASVAEEEVGGLAKVLAERMPPTDRIDFIQAEIRRTPLAAAELTSLLEEAVAAEKAEAAARVAAAEQRRAAEDASLRALERVKQLFAERRQNRLDALRREWEAEGGQPDALPAHVPAPASQVAVPKPAEKTASRGEPLKANGPEEVGFIRQVARRLVSAWLEAVRLGKPEARRFLEVVIGNLDVIEPLESEGQAATFDGVYHKADTGVSTGARVTVVRPGWRLVEDDGEYVIEQALVKP